MNKYQKILLIYMIIVCIVMYFAIGIPGVLIVLAGFGIGYSIAKYQARNKKNEKSE